MKMRILYFGVLMVVFTACATPNSQGRIEGLVGKSLDPTQAVPLPPGSQVEGLNGLKNR